MENNPLHIVEQAGGITFDILVVPRSSREKIGPVVGDRVKVSVPAPPVEGKANEAVVTALARALGVRRQDVSIVAGMKGKRKRVSIVGIRPQTLLDLLQLSSL